METQRMSQDERTEVRARKPEPAMPVQPGSLAWASAVGNQAVARLARQSAGPELEEEAPESEAEAPAGPEAAGPEEAAGGPEAGAPEAAVDPEALPEELPE